jgi:hypothetical protein
VIKVFSFVADGKPCKTRVISSCQFRGACKLTYSATCAFIKIYVDKYTDNALLWLNLKYCEYINITYYVLCK